MFKEQGLLRGAGTGLDGAPRRQFEEFSEVYRHQVRRMALGSTDGRQTWLRRVEDWVKAFMRKWYGAEKSRAALRHGRLRQGREEKRRAPVRQEKVATATPTADC